MYKRFFLSTLALALFLVITHACCYAQRTVDWIGGGGIWDDNGHWLDDQVPPQNLQPFTSDTAVIGSGVPLLNSLEQIFALSVSDGAGINIPGPGTLNVNTGNAINNGTIIIGSGGSGQFLLGPGTLSGSGQVVLVNSDFAGTGGARVAGTLGDASTTHGSSHTIRGEGTITGKWINDGLIRAEETSGDSSAILRLNHTITNNGEIRSSASGHLLISNLILANGATGQFVADELPVLFEGVNTVSGGNLESAGAGYYALLSGTTTLSGVTVAGRLDAISTAGGALIGTSAGIVNNGVINLDNMGVSNMELTFAAAGTLGGTGELVLHRDDAGTRIAGTAPITNGPDHTIRGVGRLIAPLVNEGSILAETKEGSILTVLSLISNNGLMQAESGATLLLRNESSIAQSETTGRIRAAEGGTILLQGASVTNGKLQTEGSGIIVVPAGQAFLNNVTNEGAMLGRANSLIRINGSGFTNDGTITINEVSTPGVATLEFNASGTLDGTGEVVLNRTGNNAQITSSANVVITHGADHTIRGKGQIAARFINHGRLQGVSAAEPLVLFNVVSGDGEMQDVRIAGFHVAGEVGTTAVVPIEGSYNVANSGRVLMDLAGTTAGIGYDQLSSTGPITISPVNTRLEVSLVEGFFPQAGDSFTLLTTTDILTGNFGTVTLPSLPVGLSWNQSQTASSLSITLTGSIAADFDEDGDVDQDDLDIWQTGYGTGTMHSQGDANADGDVDGRDFLVWQRSYGWGVQPLAAVTIPEPSCLILLFAVPLTNCWGRFRQSKCRTPFL